jgi:hypothetical protein
MVNGNRLIAMIVEKLSLIRGPASVIIGLSPVFNC